MPESDQGSKGAPAARRPRKSGSRRHAAPFRAHPHLYEIQTAAWLEEISDRNGRRMALADVPDSEWDALRDLGFDIVWLMGVWQRSAAAREMALADPATTAAYDRALPGWSPADVAGSPYSVAGYTPDARIGGWESLDAAREKLHARGMRLFLDFVGNHTALDHPWTRKHPEFYVQGSREDWEREPEKFARIESEAGTAFIARGKDPYFPAWRDTAQLNHFSATLRAAQIAEVKTIAEHCDGVRCDMAMLQLNDIFANLWGRFVKEKTPRSEFWAATHRAVPRLELLAEAYWGTEGRLLDLGFSYAYDKGLYDAVHDCKADEIRWRLSADARVQSQFARFLENHDEERAVAAFGKGRLPGAATLMGTLPGMRFYHQGELEGCGARLPIELRRQADAPADPEIASLFQKLLRITNEGVFHAGEWSMLAVAPAGDETSGDLIVYEWRMERAWKLIAVNAAGRAAQGRVKLGAQVKPGARYVFDDQLNDVRYERDGAELADAGLFVRRDAFQAHLFDIFLSA